ncbi:MAG: TetR/AcrR family transcriptional regulator [candidate division Zixibacteria bacterium]|nr:TetR/AcrR family transcriptional regulator [candidate division Zixibacteria bacterium]
MMKQVESRESERRTEILGAAQKCFARYGYAKTTMEDIAQTVGMKAGSLYHYYDGKGTIFRDVITYEADQMLHWLQQVVAKQKSVGRKVLSYIGGRLEYFRKVANLLDVSIQVLVEVKPLLDKIYKDVMKREIAFLSGIIQQGIDEGQIRSCNSTRVADAILAVSESLKFKGIHSSSGTSAAEVDFAATDRDVNYIVRLILEGLTISKKG